MALSSRRQFIQRSALAAVAISGQSIEAFAAASRALESPQQNAPSLDAAAIRKLASEITGHVITAQAPDYESSRLVFNRAFDQRPALIVRCEGESDIARTLDFVQRHNLPLAVRGGGHSRAGYGVCDGGAVIDLSPMKRVEVDPRKRVARAQAGSLVRDLDGATQRFGLATTSGGCPTVGLAGFTLGGGEGALMPKYGAACDNLVSAHVVTVDGRLLEVSQTSNPDLFWAIRGGGGNFGVVTAFEYRLHPVGDVLSGMLTYQTGIPELLEAFARFTRTAPDELNVFGELLPSEHGPAFLLHVCYCGQPPRHGIDLLDPLRAVHKPQKDDLRVMSYMGSQAGGFLPEPFAHFQTNLFLPELNRAAIAAITEATNDAPQQFRVLMIPFYGAVTRVGSNDTAFALRQPGCEVDMLGRWSSPAEKASAIRWVKALRDQLQPVAHGTYVNQLGETSDQLVRAAYGSNYARLVEVKKKYDPTNVLRLNQNIRPD
jgi:FAD binding domain/Berberine and berberine like